MRTHGGLIRTTVLAFVLLGLGSCGKGDDMGPLTEGTLPIYVDCGSSLGGMPPTGTFGALAYVLGRADYGHTVVDFATVPSAGTTSLSCTTLAAAGYLVNLRQVRLPLGTPVISLKFMGSAPMCGPSPGAATTEVLEQTAAACTINAASVTCSSFFTRPMACVTLGP